MAIGQHKDAKGKRVKSQKTTKRRSGNKSVKKQLFLGSGLLLGIVFLPTTVLLIIGMMPTIAAFFVDRSKRKTKAITVGSMNLAGCVPFVLELWMGGHNFDMSFSIVTDAKAIVVMYAAAAVGYLVDWAMTGIIASFLLQRGKARLKAIDKRQKELVERWGKEVTGDVVVDQYGFEIESTKE